MKFFLQLLSVIILLSAGCVSQPSWVEYQVFCGQSLDAGRQIISASQWEKFCDEVVSREFPDGFTVCDANGRWLHDGKIPVQEKTKIILIAAPDNEKTRTAIHRIADRFGEIFQQESVLIIRNTATDIQFRKTLPNLPPEK